MISSPVALITHNADYLIQSTANTPRLATSALLHSTYSLSLLPKPPRLVSHAVFCCLPSFKPRRFLGKCMSNMTFRVASGIWLKSWSDKNTKAGGNPQVGKYLGIYFVFGVGAAGLTVLQTLVLWIFCSIEVSPHSKPFTVEGVLTRGAIRHLESCMRGWQQQSSGHRCPFSMSHQPAEFSTGSPGKPVFSFSFFPGPVRSRCRTGCYAV